MSDVRIREIGSSDEELGPYVARMLELSPSVWDHTVELERWWEGLSGPQLRLVIEDAHTGALAGIASGTGLPGDPDTPIFVSIEVERELHGLGARTQAFRRLEAWSLTQRDAPRLRTSVDTSRPDDRAWWERHGFAEIDRHVITELDLADAPEPATRAVVGIEFTTAAARPELLRATYEATLDIRIDIPGDESQPLPYDEFLAVVERGERPLDSIQLALDGDRVVGVCTLVLASDRTRAHTGLTGVRREWRGRGIAAALKARQVAWCRHAGLRSIRTANHDDNAPMRAINARAGFRGVHEFATLERPAPTP